MLWGLVLVAAAAGTLWFGAELFVEHAAAAGRHLGVTGLAVGLLLAGAEPEELITAVVAALRNRGGIAAGDAIGANITMLTLVLGLVVLMRPLSVVGRVRRYFVGAALLAGVAAVLMRGGLGRAEGLILVLLYGAAVTGVWIWEGKAPPIGELAELEDSEEDDQSVSETSLHSLLFVFGGIGIMALGGWVAVLGAERLVEAFGVTDSVVGLSFVALATTAELFALAVSAQRRGISELALAGVVGSAGYNATMTLGGAALAKPIVTNGVGGAAWLAAVLPLLVIGLSGRARLVRRWGAGLLIAVYIAYLIVLYTRV